MLTIQNYVRAGSLEEAYALCQKKNNVVLGGMLWLKMQRNRVDTAIDLSGLGLDQIEETDSEYRLGAMVTLRQLELGEIIDTIEDGVIVVDATGRICFENEAYSRITGVPEATVKTRLFRARQRLKTLLAE